MEIPKLPKKSWSKQEWDQLKGITKAELIKLLDKDPNWKRCGTDGSRYIYSNAVCNFFKTFVIPVKTGIQHQHGNCWIPAFAGMTVVVFGEKLHTALL